MTGAEDPRGRRRYLSPGYLAAKVRQHGVVWCLKAAVGRQSWPAPARRTVGFLAWLFPRLRFLLRPLPTVEKRILAIWDFGSQPYSIGDLLLLEEVALALCHQHRVDLVDVCLLAEPQRPARSSFAALNVNPRNYVDFILSLLPVVLAGRHIAELHYFDSHHTIEKYIAENLNRYYVWPTGSTYASKRDLNTIAMEFLSDFHNQYQFIPVLSLRQSLVDWAKAFLKKHVASGIPIVVQLRNADTYCPERNSQMDSWVEFFQYFQGRYSAHFVVICARREVDERLRNLCNVLVAKDFDTTVDQDLALIQSAPAYMGMSSGPSTMAWFGRKPYAMFNAHLGSGSGSTSTLVRHSWGVGPVFATQHQRCMLGPETTQLLIEECVRLLSAIDAPSWEQSLAAVSDVSDDTLLRLA